MSSFLDYLDIPAFQQAVANTRSTQASGNLAVQPKPALAPLLEEAGIRARAGRQFALGERGLALDARRVRLAEDRTAYERRMAPYAIGVCAIGAGVNVLGGLRTRQDLQRQIARFERMEASGELTSATQASQVADAIQKLRAQQQAYEAGLARMPVLDALRPPGP